MIIDAYTHCGLEKFRPLPDVAAAMATGGVTRAVLAQHLGQYDNTYIRTCVADDPDRYAGVGMIDPAQPGFLAALTALVDDGILRGVRMTAAMVADHPDHAAAVLTHGRHLVLYCPEGVAGITSTLRDLAGLAEPGTYIVICHLGSPTVTDGQLSRGADIFELADAGQVLVTLSGAGMACPHPHEPLQPHVRAIVERFGPERIMWGSNFPVCGEVADYCADLHLLTADGWGLGAKALPAILGGTAERVWFS